MAGLAQMVEMVKGRLYQYSVNRPQLATFNSLTGTSMSLTPAQGYSTLGNGALLEIGSELIQMTAYDAASSTATIPSWGRAQLGTSQVTLTAGSKVTVNPLWPYWHVAQAIIDGLRKMYPMLFAVKNIELTSTVLNERFLLPADVEDVLDLRIKTQPSMDWETPLSRYTLDQSMVDGNRYLYIPPFGVAGRTIRMTYKAVPTYPTGPADGSWTFENSGFPLSAEDLPILWACAELAVAPEASRLQTFSSEQSDRARFVQGGSAVATSRRFDEQYQNRLKEERVRILDRYPPKLRRAFVG